mmetsp:Transcript_125098/g.348097  ORF Transcript_125098/g.348097 Transcript_125098/m.348097 type:complete len:212 (-) Transcript_125098:140-775(-)
MPTVQHDAPNGRVYQVPRFRTIGHWPGGHVQHWFPVPDGKLWLLTVQCTVGGFFAWYGPFACLHALRALPTPSLWLPVVLAVVLLGQQALVRPLSVRCAWSLLPHAHELRGHPWPVFHGSWIVALLRLCQPRLSRRDPARGAGEKREVPGDAAAHRLPYWIREQLCLQSGVRCGGDQCCRQECAAISLLLLAGCPAAYFRLWHRSCTAWGV